MLYLHELFWYRKPMRTRQDDGMEVRTLHFLWRLPIRSASPKGQRHCTDHSLRCPGRGDSATGMAALRCGYTALPLSSDSIPHEQKESPQGSFECLGGYYQATVTGQIMFEIQPPGVSGNVERPLAPTGRLTQTEWLLPSRRSSMRLP